MRKIWILYVPIANGVGWKSARCAMDLGSFTLLEGIENLKKSNVRHVKV